MNHKLLVVTFQDDLPQFQMFCYCLAKNWQGHQDLTVILGKNTNQDLVKQITTQFFDSSWTITICNTAHAYHNGDIEQQVNKIFYSVTSGATDVIVFDSKDFLLKPCDFSAFKKNSRYRVTYKLSNKKLVDMGYDITGIVDVPVDNLPAVSNLTPWIWNVDQLSKYWNYLNEKFGPYQSWTIFPAGNEIYGYYVYTWTDPNKPIGFLTHPDMPLLISGGWTHQTAQGMAEQAVEFDNNQDRIVWKHSRKLKDPACLNITRSVLTKYNVPTQIIDQIYGLDFIPT